jgi:enterochelin esterase-like enzyme
MDSSISEVKTFFSKHLQGNWSYKIHLPNGYEEKTIENYPVVYLLHGSDGDVQGWDFIYPLLDSLIQEQQIPPMVTVTPATGTSWWVDSDSIKYETAFIQDLIPEIDQQFRTITNRKGRGIAGYSMGGFGALRYALRYPDYFGSAMILSAALYQDLPPSGSSARTSGAFGVPFDVEIWNEKNYPGLLVNYFKTGLTVPLFIATGDDDWNHEEDFRYNVEQQAVFLYGKLHKEGGSPAELRIVNGGHTQTVWKKTFEEGIQYMFNYLEN